MSTDTLSTRETLISTSRTEALLGSKLRAFAKRLFDVLVAFLGLLFLWLRKVS